ncbi:MAG: thiamine phosphate synthase [Acidobacteriota bacterium]|nr:thiamine phosphate synthase [Acidobacteriota bacterium]
MPKLYAIADRGALDERCVRVAEFARELRDAGVMLVQYRDKVNGPQEVLRMAAEIAAIFEGSGTTLILNDRADLAVLAGFDGVHVGQEDLSVEDVRRMVGAGHSRFPPGMTERKVRTTATADSRFPAGMTGIKAKMPMSLEATRYVVGVSTHTDEQVRVADASEADYIAVGPVFATAAKLNAEPVVGLEGVRRARALTRKPIVAIGGITRENARCVIDAGADSVAVIGGLFVPGESVRKVVEDFLEILR